MPSRRTWTRLRRIGIYPAPADKRARARSRRGGARARRRAAARARHRAGRIRSVPIRGRAGCSSAGRRTDRRRCSSASSPPGTRWSITGAPDPRERELVTSILDAVDSRTRTRIVDLTGELSLSRTRRADRTRARVRRRRHGADAHRRGDGNARRSRCSDRRANSNGGRGGCAQRVVVSRAHPCRPCGIDGCGGGKVSECLTTLARRRRVRAVRGAARAKPQRAARPSPDAPRGHPPALHAVRRRRALRRERAARRCSSAASRSRSYTREWPRPRRSCIEPLIVDPFYIGGLWRDGGSRAPCRRAVGEIATPTSSNRTSASPAATSIVPATACTPSWLDERLRDAPRCERLRVRVNPYHRYVLATERKLFASPRLRAVICNSQMVQDEIRARFDVPDETAADHLQRRRLATRSVRGSRASARALRARRSDPGRSRSCTCSSAPASSAKAWRRAIEALARLPRRRRISSSSASDKHLARYARLRAAARRRRRVTLAGPQTDPQAVLRRGRCVRAADALRSAVRTRRSRRWPAGCRSSPARAAARPSSSPRTTPDSSATRATSRRSRDAHAARCWTRSAREAAAANALRAVLRLTPDAMAARLAALYQAMLGPRRWHHAAPLTPRCRAAPSAALYVIRDSAHADRGALLTSACAAAPRIARGDLPRSHARPPVLPSMKGSGSLPASARYVRPYWWAFALAVVGMVVVAAGDLSWRMLVIPIVRNFQKPDPARTEWLPLAVVGVFLLRGLGSYISEYGMAWTGHRVVFDLRRELIDKLLRLPTPYYDAHAGRRHPVEGHVRRAPARSRRRRARSRRDPQHADDRGEPRLAAVHQLELTLMTFVVLPIVAVVIRYFSRRLRRIARDIQTRTGAMTHVLEEMIGGHRIVRDLRRRGVRARARGRGGKRAAARRCPSSPSASAASSPLTQSCSRHAPSASSSGSRCRRARRGALDFADFLSYVVALLTLLERLKGLSGHQRVDPARPRRRREHLRAARP